ncbi:MAG: radical SAM protein [Nanoarchaeota archaeon]|nr:radical SAM protein [Nanoarchaeota archaeon]
MKNPQSFSVKQLYFKSKNLRPELKLFDSSVLFDKNNYILQEDLLTLSENRDVSIFFSNLAKSLYMIDSSSKKFLSHKETMIPQSFVDSNIYVRKKGQKIGKITGFFDILYIAFSNDCNLRCRYCSTKGGEFKNTNDITAVKKVIDLVAEQNNKNQIVKFLGEGEPSLNLKAIEEVTQYIRMKMPQTKIGISTNGVVSDEVKVFFLDHMDKLQISYDGCPELQDKQRIFPDGSSSSKIVEDTIDYFIKKNKKFTIKIVVTKETLGKEKKIMSHLQNLGVKTISFSQQDEFGRGKDYCPSSMDEFTEFMLKMEELSRFNGIKINHGPIQSIGNTVPVGCGAGMNVLSFGPEKILSGCLGFASSERIEELLNQKIDSDSEVNALFFGKYDDKTKKIEIDEKRLKKLRDRINVHEICQQCEFLYFCGAGCPLKNALNNGELKKPFKEYCEGTKSMFRKILYYVSERYFIEKLPYFKKKGDSTIFRTKYFEFPVNSNTFIILDSNTDIDSIHSDIEKHMQKNMQEFVVFFISPRIEAAERNLQFGHDLLSFIRKLKSWRASYMITRPIFKCLAGKKTEGLSKGQDFATDCTKCIELFYVKDDVVHFCNGKKGKRFDSYTARDEILADFYKTIENKQPNESCIFCPEFIRKKCNGCFSNPK